MHKIFQFVFILFCVSFIIGCDFMNNKEKCLNSENFEKFYFNDNLYTLAGNYYDIISKYDFYGEMHKIGYTIGVYNKIFETYVLDIDTEENILFQKDGKYFWIKDGFEFPDLSNVNINKLLVQKFDYEGNIVEEKEFLLENILINDLLVEYDVDDNKDSFLVDNNNFLTYRIKYIYENGIVTKYYDRMTIYNNNLFIENINEHNERIIYVLNEEISLCLYEFILNIY